MKIKDEFDYQVLNLTDVFFDAYPDSPYKEIARKKNRPYACLLIQSHYGYFIAIPYRSHINHKYAYRFKKSRRSQRARSGLDYSKVVIITNVDYIGAEDAIIDQDEYKETRDKTKFDQGVVEQFMRTKLLACATLKNELEFLCQRMHISYETIWIESGLHNRPELLHKRIQAELDQIKDCDRLLVAFGNCGNALTDLQKGDYEMIIPKVEDIVHLTRRVVPVGLGYLERLLTGPWSEEEFRIFR